MAVIFRCVDCGSIATDSDESCAKCGATDVMMFCELPSRLLKRCRVLAKAAGVPVEDWFKAQVMRATDASAD
jgi:hypothetical protein